MNYRLLVAGLALVSFAAQGCAGDAGGIEAEAARRSGEGSAGAGGAGGSGTGGGGAGGGGGGEVALAEVRIAHLSPDAPALDVCLLPEGVEQLAPVGPLFGKRFEGAGDLGFGEASAYAMVPPARYTLRLVAAGASDCTAALAGSTDAVNVELEANRRYTLAAMGQLDTAGGAEGLALGHFVDAREPVLGLASMRFVHASPDMGAADMGTLDAQGTFTAIFPNVVFGKVGTTAGGSTYYAAGTMEGATLVARPAGQDVLLLHVFGVNLGADRMVTIFAVGNREGQPAPLGLLVCDDAAEAEDPSGKAHCVMMN